MASGLLSLKWNNHRSTFFHVLSNIRSKESYCDVTLACDGRFYSLHKFVLSTCSEYFEEMFERTQCKHPVIVLKDINSEDLEALLNYMYVGEVNVVQEKLAGLIKAAECLKIKGLAVPDEDPMESKDNSSIERERHKRSQRGEDSPRAKRRRRENSSDVSEEILSPVRSRPSARSREYHGNQNAKSAPVAPSEENEEGSRETHGLTDASEEAENSSINANRRTDGPNKTKLSSQLKSKREPEQVNLEEEDEQEVKTEPQEEEEEGEVAGDEGGGDVLEELDSKASLHEQLGLDVQDATDDGFSSAGMLEGQLDGPSGAGASGYHENSFLWEGDGSLSAFPAEGFSGDASQSRQMFGGGHNLSYFTSSSPAVPTWLSETQYEYAPPVLAAKSPKLSVVGRAAASNSAPLGAPLEGGKRIDSAEPKAFVCTFCSYQTNIKTNFRVHLRTHTGEKPYKCPYCPYRSSHKSNLKPHMMRHQTQYPVNSNCSIESEGNLQADSVASKLSTMANTSIQVVPSVPSVLPTTSSILNAGQLALSSTESRQQCNARAVSSDVAPTSAMSSGSTPLPSPGALAAMLSTDAAGQNSAPPGPGHP